MHGALGQYNDLVLYHDWSLNVFKAAQFFGQLCKMVPISCDAMAADLQT
jgi:hypothetical protein